MPNFNYSAQLACSVLFTNHDDMHQCRVVCRTWERGERLSPWYSFGATYTSKNRLQVVIFGHEFRHFSVPGCKTDYRLVFIETRSTTCRTGEVLGIVKSRYEGVDCFLISIIGIFRWVASFADCWLAWIWLQSVSASFTCWGCPEFGWVRSFWNIIYSMIGWLDGIGCVLPSVLLDGLRRWDWGEEHRQSRSSAPLIALLLLSYCSLVHTNVRNLLAYSFHGDYSLLPSSNHPRKE